MDKQKIARINFLAKKSREEGLTDEEKAEQQKLRDEYRAYMRNGYMPQLEKVYITDGKGNVTKLIKEDVGE